MTTKQTLPKTATETESKTTSVKKPPHRKRVKAEPVSSPPPPAAKAAPPVKASANVAKWGKTNMDAGWVCIPNILVRRQRTLGLDAVDINILLHLLTYWWEDENHPHPSRATLASAMDLSVSTIQRHIRGMERAGFIKRTIRPRAKDRNETNLYDLTPLRGLLEPHSKVELDERNASREGRRTRATKVAKLPTSAPE